MANLPPCKSDGSNCLVIPQLLTGPLPPRLCGATLVWYRSFPITFTLVLNTPGEVADAFRQIFNAGGTILEAHYLYTDSQGVCSIEVDVFPPAGGRAATQVTCPPGWTYDPISERCVLTTTPPPIPPPIPPPPPPIVPPLPIVPPSGCSPIICKPPGQIVLIGACPTCQFDPPIPSHLPRIPAAKTLARPTIDFQTRLGTSVPILKTALNPTLRRGLPVFLKPCGCDSEVDLEEVI
jgi:hypothetical protein